MRANLAHIRAFFNLVDLALSDTKKECYDVASVFKQVSGGVLMWALVIRSGQDLTLQANDYCIPNSVYGGSNPPFFKGETLPRQAVPMVAYGFPIFAVSDTNRKRMRGRCRPTKRVPG